MSLIQGRRCKWCGREFTREELERKSERKYCSNSCQAASKKERAEIRKVCEWCGKEMVMRRCNERRFCDRSCSAKWRMNHPVHKAKAHNEEVAKKRGLSRSAWLHSGNPKALKEIERIRMLNPMSDPESRKRVSMTLRKIGHKPLIQGGNGRGLTAPQKKLLEKLGEDWIPEYIVRTGINRYYPTHYKIDLANLDLMIVIEVDGYGHVAIRQKVRDRKKEEFLRERGWKVLRFTNREILSSIDTVMNQVTLYCGI